jgi:hypothetical protein
MATTPQYQATSHADFFEILIAVCLEYIKDLSAAWPVFPWRNSDRTLIPSPENIEQKSFSALWTRTVPA